MTLPLVVDNKSEYARCPPCTQRQRTHPNVHLRQPEALKVTEVGMDFPVPGLNLNLIALIKSDEVHKLVGLNDLMDFCLSRRCLVTRIEKAGAGGIVNVQTHFFFQRAV